MSAYANGRKSQIISLAGAPASLPIEEQSPALVLPQFIHELESYLTRVKQLESALIQERSEKKKVQDQLRELQGKFDLLMSETEAKIQNFIAQEQKLKVQVSTYEDQEKKLEETQKILRSERNQRKKQQEQMNSFYAKYQQFVQDIKLRLQESVNRQAQYRSQLQLQKNNEVHLKAQIESLLRQVKRLQEDAKKTEIETELLKAQWQAAKQQEQEIKTSLRTIRSNEGQQTNQLNQELLQVRAELKKYKAAWSQAGHKIRQSTHHATVSTRRSDELARRSDELSRRVEELREALATERRRSEHLEELMKKEKREKQLALSHLHAAESRMAQLNHAIENLRRQDSQNIQRTGLELQF
jgi:chromosome segregation ATPase